MLGLNVGRDNRIEFKLKAAGINRTAENVIADMRHLHSILAFTDARSNPKRKIEVPSKTQSEVLTAFGYRVDGSGVLQPRPA